MNPEIRYAKNEDVHIAFQVVGTGPIDILSMADYPLAPPMDGWWEQPPLARAVRRLAAFSRLILWDRRGSGLSDRRAEADSLEVNMEDALAVMEAAGSERAVVVGWGPGGLLAMLLAATRPDRVTSLVLFNAFATSVWRPDYPWGQPAEEREAEIDQIVQRWGTAQAVPIVAPSMADDAAFVSWWSRFELRALSPGAVRPYWHVLGEIDARPILSAIKVPTLVLHRPGSFMQVENAHYLTERIPHTRYVELPGSTRSPGSMVGRHSLMRSRSSSPAGPRPIRMRTSSRPCCSRTWSRRRSWPPRSATGAGVSSSTHTRR